MLKFFVEFWNKTNANFKHVSVVCSKEVNETGLEAEASE